MHDNVYSNLDKMTIDGGGYGSGGNLKGLMRIIGLKTPSTKKMDMIKVLYEYYSKPTSASELYERLNKYEKELLTCIVQSKYSPLIEELKAIAKAYDFIQEKNWYSSYLQFFPKNSPLYAFFVNGSVPMAFKEYLAHTIPDYVREYTPCEVDEEEFEAKILGREMEYKDFDLLLSFTNSHSVTATTAGKYPGKSPLLKFHKLAAYDEICKDGIDISEIKNAGQTTVSMGLFQLLRCSKVIEIEKNKFKPSKKADFFAGCTMLEKAEFLLESYLNNGSNQLIDECARISAPKLKISRSKYNLADSRQEIVDYLKECPVNVWIKFDQLSKEIRKDNPEIFNQVGSVLVRDEYYMSYDCEASWGEFEHIAINHVLMEYLAVLGAVDILAEVVDRDDYGNLSAYETIYFRITDLGAYLFGIHSEYKEKQSLPSLTSEGGFTVYPNFEVVIPNSKEKLRHELFFNRFSQPTEEDAEATVYHLDFKAMVQALDLGITIREIADYCMTCSNGFVPENVWEAFSKWEEQSKLIRIRTVSVIESDDPFLLEEILKYPGIKAITESKTISSHLVLSPGNEKKAKRLIEKKNQFCHLDNSR